MELAGHERLNSNAGNYGSYWVGADLGELVKTTRGRCMVQLLYLCLHVQLVPAL